MKSIIGGNSVTEENEKAKPIQTLHNPSQLTQSSYLQQLYEIQNTIDNSVDTVTEPEDLETVTQEIIDSLQSLKDETEEKLNNMPESLQTSPTGELLQERIDCLDNAVSELENINFEFDEGNEESKEDWITEKIQEIQSISLQ